MGANEHREVQYDDYVARRTKFADAFQTVIPSGWMYASRYNQIARASIDFTGKTFGGLKTELEEVFQKMSATIDNTLAHLQQTGRVSKPTRTPYRPQQ